MIRLNKKLTARLPSLTATAVLILLAPVTRSTRAAITLSADFDSGSLCLTASNACDDNGVPSSVSGNTVTLVGRDNFNPGDWKWIYFQAAGVNGQAVTFEIGDDFETGASSLNGHKMVYSYNQQDWSFFDQNFRTPTEDKFTFFNNSPFTQNTVYVAYGLPYPYQRVVDHTAGLVGSPWVSPTASADENLVVGHSPGGVDDIGRIIAPHNLYGYEITDPAAVEPKKKIVLNSGVHANETLGDFVVEGLVDFLVSEDLRAAQLRRYAEFYVYPMTNPDGRYAGNNRTTVAVGDVDLNRAWNPPSYTEPGDASPIVEDATVGEAMRADTGGDVDYLIDFHSTVNGKSGHYGYILPDWQNDPFWTAVRAREPEVLTGTALLQDFTAAKFGRDELNAEFSATFETEFIADENIDRFLNLGRNFGLAWYDAFAVPADLNFDGVLDADDWLAFIAGSETDLSGLTEIEQYARGDLNGDGMNDILDFAIFKQTYVQQNGAGAFAALFENVPESSSLILAAIGIIAKTVGRPRSKRRPSMQYSFV
jgi:Zinc carboxypeptidase/Cytosolic carboxypeptidase N-terminal domain